MQDSEKFKGSLVSKFFEVLATFFYVGYLPKCPGTFGTLATLPVIWFCQSSVLYILLAVILFFMGKIATEDRIQKTGREDPKEVVIDEVVGMMVTMLFIPLSVVSLAIGFILFRFFDILKPFYIRRLEKIPGGYGVMLDDLLAGVYANIILHLFLYLLSVISGP